MSFSAAGRQTVPAVAGGRRLAALAAPLAVLAVLAAPALAQSADSELAGTLVIENGEYTNTDLLDASVLIEPAGTLNNQNRVTGTVETRGTLNNSGEIAEGVTNSGSTINDGTVNGGATNSGDWRGTGSINGDVVNTGTFSGTQGIIGNVTNSNTFLNGGSINGDVTSSGDFNNYGLINGAVTNEAGGVFLQSGSLNGTVTNSGQWSGAGQSNSDVTNTATGSYDNSGSLTGSLDNAGTALNSGVINGTVTNEAEGTLANSGTINGSIANSGSLTNSGQLNSTIDNAAGATFVNNGAVDGTLVNAGTATNDGAVNGDITNAGTLYSRGSINGSLINSGSVEGAGGIAGNFINSGLYSTGDAVAELSVGGNASFLPGSVFAAKVGAAGISDTIAVSGGLTLSGGTVSVTTLEGFVPGIASYTLITADGGITGTFSAVTNPLGGVTGPYPFLGTTLTYTGSSVSVLFSHAGGASFSLAGLTANQRQTGLGADTLPLSSRLLATLVLLDFQTAPAALDALSGEIFAGVKTVMTVQADLIRQAVLGRLRADPRDATAAALEESAAVPVYPDGPATGLHAAGMMDGLSFWAGGYGGAGNNGGDSPNTADINNTLAGGLIGADYLWPAGEGNLRVGLFGGYGGGHFDLDARASSGTVRGGTFGGYGALTFDALALRLGVAHTWQSVQTVRTVAFTGYSAVNRASYDAGITQVFGEAGYRFGLGTTSIEPFAGLSYTGVTGGDFTETGSDSALSGQSGTFATVASTLGARFAVPVTAGFALRGDVAWQHVFSNPVPTTTLAFTGASSSYSLAGAPVARDALLLGAGVVLETASGLRFDLGYYGQLGSSAQENAVQGTLKMRF